MPYTLKTSQISVKDPETGEYSGVDILAEQTEEGLIAELQAEGTKQVNRITKAATDVQAAVDKAETDAAELISDTQTSINTLEAQKNTIAQTVASMAELGTDTTFTTPGMAADAGAVGDLSRQLSDVKTALTDPVTGLDTKAPVIIESVGPADIASFSDGADSMPIKKLVANIEPVQDLHGYENPWPAGGNTNLLRFPYEASGAVTVNGITFTINDDGTVNASGTATATASAELYTTAFANMLQLENDTQYITSGVMASGAVFICYVYVDGTPSGENTARYNQSATFTTPATGDVRIRGIVRILSGTTVNGTVWKPMLEKGSTAHDFVPYSNICPISGHTGMSVVRAGKNLYNNNFADYIKPVDYCICPIKLEHGKQYSVSGHLKGTAQSNFTVGVARKGIRYTEFGSFITCASGNYSDREVTFLVDDEFTDPKLIVYAANESAFNAVFENYEIQLELNSSVTAYEPYTSTTLPISWETEAGTVYGGTLDLVSGRLTVTHGIATENDFTDIATGFSAGGLHWADYNLTNITTNGNVICSILGQRKDENAGWAATTPCYAFTERARIRVYCTESTLAEFREAYTGLQIVYPFATSIEYQLDPQEIRTLLGANNVWVDTGDIEECEYPADTKLYIQQLTKPTEDDMTANANIAANKFFMIGNALYYSTAAIAAGATIIPGTNCNAVSLADALNTLNA